RALGADHTALGEGRVVRLGDIADDKLSAEFRDFISLNEIVERRSRVLEIRLRELSKASASLDQEILSLNQLIDRFFSLENTSAELARLEQELRTATREAAQLQNRLASCQFRIAQSAQALQRAEGPLGFLFGNPQRIRESMVSQRREQTYLEGQRGKIEARLDEMTEQQAQMTVKIRLLEEDLRDVDRHALTSRRAEARDLHAQL